MLLCKGSYSSFDFLAVNVILFCEQPLVSGDKAANSLLLFILAEPAIYRLGGCRQVPTGKSFNPKNLPQAQVSPCRFKCILPLIPIWNPAVYDILLMYVDPSYAVSSQLHLPASSTAFNPNSGGLERTRWIYSLNSQEPKREASLEKSLVPSQFSSFLTWGSSAITIAFGTFNQRARHQSPFHTEGGKSSQTL